MAVLSVPRSLQERLGDAATDSLVAMFREAEANQLHDQEQQRKEQHEQLFVLLEERFLRHVAESEGRVRAEMAECEVRLRTEMAECERRLLTEMNAGFARHHELIAGLGTEIEKVRTEVSEQIGALRTDVGKEIRDVHKLIGDVHKQIAVQTRWLLTLLIGAAVLLPVLQQVLRALFPA